MESTNSSSGVLELVSKSSAFGGGIALAVSGALRNEGLNDELSKAPSLAQSDALLLLSLVLPGQQGSLS